MSTTKTTTKKPKRTKILSAPWTWFLVTICIFIAVSMAFEVFKHADLYSDIAFAAPFYNSNYMNNQLLAWHIYLAVPPCIIGPFMFHEQLRNNNLWWHRQFGKAYIICCCASGALGLLLALGKAEYPMMAAGFGTLASLWFYTSYTAYRRARSRNFKSHRRWMIRSFALTFAFFMVKIWTYILNVQLGIDEYTAMTMKGWLAWVPNLIIMETYIWSTDHRGKWVGWFKTMTANRPQPKPEQPA